MRYFFQFIVWFWTKNLDKPEDRWFMGSVLWLCLFILATIISLPFPGVSTLAVIGWFMFGTLITAGLAFVTVVTVIIYLTYREWQQEVIDKLKGK